MAEALRRDLRPSAVGQPRRHRPDYLLIIIMTLLLAIGMIVVYAISPALAATHGTSDNYYVTHQLIAIVLGAVMFGVTSRIPLDMLRQNYKTLAVIALGATVVALLLPVNPSYPAHRWIRAGGFSFQSVELVKFALLIWFASFMAMRMKDNTVGDMQKTLKPITYVLLAIGVIVAGVQSDLGSTGVIVLMMGTMAFVAGLPMKRIILIVLMIGVLLVLAVSTTPYRRERLMTFLNPSANCLTTGYQVCQALIAVGSGGATGLGLGRSVQAYGYLPEAENDSIFAIYAEKFGFIGVTALIALFLAFFMRIKRVAERAPDNFSRLVVIGILVWLCAQSMINIGAMMGLLPLKGITLPLISYGGSSVLLVMAVLGIVFQVSRYTSLAASDAGGTYENRRDGRRLRGAYHPNSGSRT
ncbi:MAG: FtsW/RodA/SpoVE family cell cycle protein [Candidatus Saccharibacteria bacterium]